MSNAHVGRARLHDALYHADVAGMLRGCCDNAAVRRAWGFGGGFAAPKHIFCYVAAAKPPRRNKKTELSTFN
jgi:hypothetical protein